MKKLLSIILVFVLIFVFVACGKKLPDGFDQALYDYAKAAYELVYDYNHGKISKDDAEERAKTIASNVDALTVPNKDEEFQQLYVKKQKALSVYLGTFALNLRIDKSDIIMDNTKIEEVFKGLLE